MEKGEDWKIKLFAIFGFILLTTIFLIFNKVTGRATVNLDEQYGLGEMLAGQVSLTLVRGDRMPVDSEVVFALTNANGVLTNSTFTLSQFIAEQAMYNQDYTSIENCDSISLGLSQNFCHNVSIPLQINNCTVRHYTENNLSIFKEICFKSIINKISVRCVSGSSGQSVQQVCSTDFEIDSYYDSPGRYSRDISDFLNYTFQDRGGYTLTFTIPTLNVSDERKIVVQ